jgi:hypothetical protein
MVEYVSVSDGIPLIGEMSQHQRAGRCLAEEAALRFWPFAAIGESVVRGHVAAERCRWLSHEVFRVRSFPTDVPGGRG